MPSSLVAKKEGEPAVLAPKASEARIFIVLRAMFARDFADHMHIGVAAERDHARVNRYPDLVAGDAVPPGACRQKQNEGRNLIPHDLFPILALARFVRGHRARSARKRGQKLKTRRSHRRARAQIGADPVQDGPPIPRSLLTVELRRGVP